MTAARLTLAIPFHRGLPYLKIAIESVIAQTCDDWCLLVCDDGRVEDGAERLVQSFGDARLRYVANDRNLGMVGNWNRCLDESDTELVTLLHGDDRILPNYVATMTGLADDHPRAAAFFCAAAIIDAAGRNVFSFADAIKRFFTPSRGDPLRLSGEGALRALMAGNFIMCPTLCYRKSVIGTRRFDPAWKQVQDLEFTTRLLLDGHALIGTRTVAYAYRRHAEAATEVQSRSLLRFEEEFRLFAEVARRAEAQSWHRAAETARACRIVRLHLGYRTLGDVLLGRFGSASDKLRMLVRNR